MFFYNAALVYGNTRYPCNANVQSDCDAHFPVYKVNIAGTLSAVKCIAFPSADDADRCCENIVDANYQCSGVVVPVKSLEKSSVNFRGQTVVVVELVTMWSSLSDTVTIERVLEMAFKLTFMCIYHNRYFNDMCRRNMGHHGFFDIDEEWGECGDGNGCYASHSLLLLMWMQEYEPEMNIPTGNPMTLSLVEKGKILACVNTSRFTQTLIFAEMCRDTLRGNWSADADYADAKSVVATMHAMTATAAPTTMQTYVRMVGLVYEACRLSLDTGRLFSLALKDCAKHANTATYKL